jgi:putative transposase
MQKISHAKSVDLIAWVILPDHFHVVVDIERLTISSYMQSAKQSFSMKYLERTGQSGKVWQYRFWDHIVRGEDDLRRHLDYIHYNPVKHGIVADPFSYRLSSAAVYLERGQYERDWGTRSEPDLDGEYGE